MTPRQVEISVALAGLRAKDVAKRLNKGVRLTVDNAIEVIGALPPAKRAKYLKQLDMFIATAKFFVKQADTLMLPGPMEKPESEE